MPFAHITGWGMSVPERVLTNQELADLVDTSDEWIRGMTGIHERRIADESESTAVLASQAAINALKVANLRPTSVNLIIVATSTPEHLFPSTASLVQDTIGASNAGAFDLSAACTGFIFALTMASMAIQAGGIKNALVIGAETLSRFVNWEDRNTCILFGDGAGAFVLQASLTPGGVQRGVMRSDGSGGDLLSLPAGGSRMPASAQTIQDNLHTIQMNGKEVFRFATRVMAQATRQAVEVSNLKMSDIHRIVPHQANLRIIEAAARGLHLPLDKFEINLDRYGNTSTASIPIATCEAVADGRINAGENLVFVGFGAGLTWGAIVVQWTGLLPIEKKVPIPLYRILSQLRSLLLRVYRRIEGVIWGR